MMILMSHSKDNPPLLNYCRALTLNEVAGLYLTSAKHFIGIAYER